MHPSEEMQWDLENAPPGGTFLVLNVGTNTVGLGSSCFFQSFPPAAIRSVSPREASPSANPHDPAGDSNQEAVENIVDADAGGDSTVKGPALRKKPRHRKKKEEDNDPHDAVRDSNPGVVENIAAAAAAASAFGDGGDSTVKGPALRKKPINGWKKEEDNDPDWVLDVGVNLENDLPVCRKVTRQSSRLQQDANRFAAMAHGGANTDAVPSSDDNPSGPIQSWQGDLPQDSTEGENVMVPSGTEFPPMYLVNLLRFFGWIVTFREGQGAFYTSPQGVVHHSLPKAFENFLHDSYKCNETMSSSSQTSNGGVPGAPDVDHQTGQITWDVVKESLIQRKGRKNRNDATVAAEVPVVPQGSSERQLAGIQETNENDGKRSVPLPEETVSRSKEVKRMAFTARKTRKGSEGIKKQHPQLPGPRRSARLRGKYPFYGSDSDSEHDIGNSSLYLPETGVEMPTSSTSDDANKICDEKLEPCMEDEIPASRKLDCSDEILTEKNQSYINTMHQENAQLEVGRSGHGNNEHVSVDVEVNLEKGCESNFMDFSEILDSNAVENKGKLMSLEPLSLNVAHQTAKSCNEVDHLVSDNKRFHNHNIAPAINAQNGSAEIKRYMDLNMEDVAVDKGMRIEKGVDACFSKSSMLPGDSLISKNNEKAMASAFEVGNLDGETHISDNVFVKEVLAEEVDCDMSRTQIELESHILKKNNRIAKKGSGKHLQQEDNLKVPAPGSCFPLSASKRKSTSGGNSNGRRKKRRGGCSLVVRKNMKDGHQKAIFSQNKVTALSWLIDAGILSENEMLVHKVNNDRGDHLRGLATRDGIWCICCEKILSLLEFESHAGGDLYEPWNNICLVSGKSLMQCQMEAWENEKKLRKVGFQTIGVEGLDPSDDTCGVCADGGHLICCDSCPSTFHQDCIKLTVFPEGKWYCPYCICTFCSEAEGASDGVNKTLSLFTCQLCYQKYHWECTRQSGMHKKLAESLLFCRKNCNEVDAGLLELLGVVNKIGEGFSWTLLKRLDEHEELNSDQNLLFMMECNRKLSMALSVLNECFMPLVDNKTGVDLISHAVYNCGSNFKRLNYAGFYSAILERDGEIISVASLRFHGRNLAEMPFIGTRPMHRRQGMCRRLLKAIENLLASLHVEKLIIPATAELLETWMTSFSFKPLEQFHKDEIRNLSLVVFPQAFLLQKSMPPKGKDDRGYDLAGAVVAPRAAAPGIGMDDLQNYVGKQTNTESCDVGPRRNSESCRDGGKHSAPQSNFSSAADSCGGGLHLGSSYKYVPEASYPAQYTPTSSCCGAPSTLRETGSQFSSFDRALDRSYGDKEAAGGADAPVARRSQTAGMEKNIGDSVCCSLAAGYASPFQWTSS